MSHHPTQPLKKDDKGTERFKANGIVVYLLEVCRQAKICDLNTLAMLPFDIEDRVQLAQLLGYSACGFGELSYVTDKAYNRAMAEGNKKR